MSKKHNILAASALFGTTIARTVVKSLRKISYRDKVVVITGGSRGLGLVMARQLARQGARLALIARNEKELTVACEELRSKTQAEYFVCDVRKEKEVNAAVAGILDKFGTIDILINDAGVIQVGPFESMTVYDFKNAMDNHFFANLYTTLAVLPTMKKNHFGRIVNISSIGGRLSVPHLLPYTASKYALAGFSEGLRNEVMKDGICVTTVCPGLMRTGSHLQAEFKGQNKLEYAWFSTLGALPLLSTAAECAAKTILKACKNGDAEVVLTLPAQLAVKLKALFPEETADALSFLNYVLPAIGGIGKDSEKGIDSQSALSPNAATVLSEEAAVKNNQFVS